MVHRVEGAHAAKFGGLSVHHLTEASDGGAIVTQARFRIELWDTPWDIVYKYSDFFSILLREALLLLNRDADTATPNERGRYYSKVEYCGRKRSQTASSTTRFVPSVVTVGGSRTDSDLSRPWFADRSLSLGSSLRVISQH